jgi:drug/metabolite transporter (DMT)-like permease
MAQPAVSPTSRRTAYLLLGIAICIGSVSFTLIKMALEELSPYGLATGRVVASAVMFTVVMAVGLGRRSPIARGDRWLLVLAGLGGSMGFHLVLNAGYPYVSVAVAAVIMATTPVLVAVGEVVFLRHRLRPQQLLGLALTLVGCSLIGAMSDGGGETTLLGVVLGLAAAALWAAVTVATRSIANKYDPWWLNTPGTVLGAVLMLAIRPSVIGELADVSWKGLVVTIWLGTASSAFIYYAYAKVMQVLPATVTMSVGTVVTPLGVLVGWVWLGSSPTWVEALGGAVVLMGAVLVTRQSVLPAAA